MFTFLTGSHCKLRPNTEGVLVDYFAQRSLRNVLDSPEAGLPLQLQLEILCGVCAGIHHLHSHPVAPVCHGDLKAANILLQRDNTPYITDFGTARFKTLAAAAAVAAGGATASDPR